MDTIIPSVSSHPSVQRQVSPRELGVPHDSWRPNQYEAYAKAVEIRNRRGNLFLEAPVGTGKCLPLNSIVQTPNGMVEIGNLQKYQSVTSLNMDILDVQSSYIEHVFDVENRDCIRLTTQRGFEIECSREHKILVWNGEFEWINASDLRLGKDFVVVPTNGIFPTQNVKFSFAPRVKPGTQKRLTFPNSINIDLAYFIGVVIGDGGMTGKNAVHITTMDSEIEDSVYSISKSFGLHVGKHSPPENKASTYRLSSTEFKQFLEFLGVKPVTARYKEVPWSILQSSREIQSAFLQGLFDTDGGMSGYFEYGTSSKKLSTQVQLMLAQFGIISTRRHRKKTNSYRISISGKSLRVFEKEIGFKIQRKQYRLLDAISKRVNTNTEVFPYLGSRIHSLWKKYVNVYHSHATPRSIIDEHGPQGAMARIKANTSVSHKLISSYWSGQNPSKEMLVRILDALEFHDEMLSKFANSNIYFDTISFKEDIGSLPTIDISVLPNNNFIAQGIVVHNSSVPTALGADGKVHVLVHTLSLLDQYEKEYGFVGVKGKPSYLCVLDKKVAEWRAKGKTPTAADCHFSPMQKCPAKDECPYLIARAAMMAAKRSVSTYRYAALSHKMSEMQADLVCDEAHAASEELISFNTMTISPRELDTFALPRYPFATYGENDKGAILAPADAERLHDWIDTCISVVNAQFSGVDPEDIWASQLRNMKARLNTYRERLDTDNWFLMFEVTNGKRQMHLKALTSRIAAQRLFANKGLKMFMSGTIGTSPAPLAKELGIEEGEYEYLVFPHPVPIEARPIWDLGMQSMSAYNLRNYPNLYQVQARVIWNWQQQFDPRWRGLILTTSFTKIKELAQYIRKWASPRRVIVQGELSLAEAIDTFLTKPRDGDIAIGTIQGWGSGLDFRGDLARWVAVAGVPHVNPTDQYAKARRSLAGGEAYEKWYVYSQIVQATGRVSRGERTADGGFLENHAALADGMATTKKAIGYYSNYFVEAMRKA